MKTNYNPMRRLSVLALVSLGLVVAHAQAAGYPNLRNIQEPTADYLSFPPFNPPIEIGLSVDARAPQIAEWTRENQPGDTMALAGESLSSFSGDAEGRDSRFVFYGGGTVSDGLIQRLDGRQCAITLPENLPADEMYLMWPHNDTGYGEPIAINKTEAWWIGPNSAPAGGVFSVYGRNLSLGGNDCYLYIEGHGWITNSVSNPYKADFTVPKNLPEGTYTVWAHNGQGREYGWAEALTLKVASAAYDWSAGVTKNIADFGAVPGDGQDDLEAINAAIAATPAGGTVYFPDGTFNVSSRIYIAGKRMKGAGMDRTKLTSAAGMENQPSTHSTLCYPNSSGAWIEDMELSVGDYVSPSSVLLLAPFLKQGEFSNVRFSHLDIGVNPGVLYQTSILTVENGKNILFKDCEFIVHRPLNLNGISQLSMDHCNFYGIYDCNVMIYMSGASEVSMRDCTMQPYNDVDSSSPHGWGKGRWISGNSPEHFYIGGNTNLNACPRNPTPFQSNLHPVAIGSDVLVDGSNSNPDLWRYKRTITFSGLTRNWLGVDGGVMNITASTGGQEPRGYHIDSYNRATGEVVVDTLGWHKELFPVNLNFTATLSDNVDQNSGEQIMFEGCFTTFRGNVVGSTASATTFGKSTAVGVNGKVATIIGGTGLGQARRVVSVSGNSIALDRPWRIVPDGTSTISIGKFGYNTVLFNNHFEGVSRAADPAEYTATAGFSSYGGYHGAVVVSNTIKNVNVGIVQWSLPEATDLTQAANNVWTPNYFGYYAGNAIRSVQTGLGSSIKAFRTGSMPYADRVMLGSVWRGNRVENATVGTVSMSCSSDLVHSGLQVMQGTVSPTVSNGVFIESGYSNLVFVGNDFGSESIVVAEGTTTAMRGNTWASYVFNGTNPSPVIELPLRILPMPSGSFRGDAVVYNSGTAPLDWSASESSSWLRLLKSSGSIPGENSQDTLSFELETTPAAGSQAIVTVAGGGRSMQITVVYGEPGPAFRSTNYSYPLSGFGGSPLRAELYDRDTGETRVLGGVENMPELTLEDLVLGHEYRLRLQEQIAGTWIYVEGSERSFRHK